MFEREWDFYLDDMILFSKKVLAYTEGLDQESFEADEKAYDATLRKLELIGEAATHIPEKIRETSPSIPWRQVIATRNRLIHGYLGKQLTPPLLSLSKGFALCPSEREV